MTLEQRSFYFPPWTDVLPPSLSVFSEWLSARVYRLLVSTVMTPRDGVSVMWLITVALSQQTTVWMNETFYGWPHREASREAPDKVWQLQNIIATVGTGSFPPRLINCASMSLYLLPTQSPFLTCTVNMLNHPSTNTWYALYTRTGAQHIFYVQSHCNCIPKALQSTIDR